MSEITAVKAKAIAQEARRLAEVDPEHHASCTYVRYEGGELEPNCIVGRAMANLGIPLSELENNNGCSIRHLAGVVSGWVAPTWLDVADEDAGDYVNWLNALQGHQDRGATWGGALAYADRRLVIDKFGI